MFLSFGRFLKLCYFMFIADVCAAGSAYSAALGRCVLCELGYHQELTNQVSCDKCDPDGYTTLNVGTDDADECVRE